MKPRPAKANHQIVFNVNHPVPEELLHSLRYEFLRRELWAPLGKEAGRIRVVIDDPDNLLKKDMIENLLRTKEVDYYPATKEDILKYINHFYGIDEAARLNGLGVSESDSKIVRLVNEMINEACNRRASDIHIEPDVKEKQVYVRFRVDGECLSFKTHPYDYRAAIVSRIKIMSNLDITERRLPQDGKIQYKRPNGEDVELRVATIPTHGYVEDVVMRILTRGKIMTMGDLQMEPDTRERFEGLMKKPYGLILLVGPTGSGKTTTAHAVLHVLNRPGVKIWTVEDPVEITQKGIRQVQVHHKIGLDFGNAMRAFLRADPDIIMVGEMRDYETAKMGVDASTTGHLVLTTLHTNNAPETIIRLLDMGIDPFAFADSLLCVMAQRLVRRLCLHCREPYNPQREEYEDLARNFGEKDFNCLNLTYDESVTIYRAKGCPECHGVGYRGMMGLYELLVASDNIKQMIIGKRSIAAIRKTAREEGMRTLMQSGILKVLNGDTDFVEVLSVCMR
ncbi:MAG: GspE/PulE family protein [Deltaproteobacteria bacterium]|nr:GspE/PulE family protein [Deltaproteobacteria bacterium]